MTGDWRRAWGWVREWFQPLAVALLLTQFGASAVRVDGASMLPALRHGEWLVVGTAAGWAHRLGLSGYARGDIVVFKPPREAAYEWTNVYRGLPLPWRYRPFLVKRVAGLPGDRVALRGGVVWVNGQPLPEEATKTYWAAFCPDTTSLVANSVAASPTRTTLAEVTVPPGHYFVLGDNRSPGGSLDSRTFGPVPVADIAGRAAASVWPLLRPERAVPPCDGQPQPERRVKLEGETQIGPRLLQGTH
ncbi:signal peptidase I [Deinococcus sp. HMF7620]|uniref:Signal peptidase I n=1 Tax=Deinococcus arboris TaxID=2682977 RepID=A0A7C9LIX3_9DEIO|nr:signal peptidase I [Deinococcus arboris]MVN85418.1 signal peptidase I [Deinococcus arboris]